MEDLTDDGIKRSRLLGENMQALVDGGISFWAALDALLKTYPEPSHIPAPATPQDVQR